MTTNTNAPSTTTVVVPIPQSLLRAAEGTPEKSDERYAIFRLACELEDEIAYDDDDVVSVSWSEEPPDGCFSYRLTLADGVDTDAAHAAALSAAQDYVQQYAHQIATEEI